MEQNSASPEYDAYIPCYNNGNCVLAVLSDGTSSIIQRSIKAQLDMLLKEHNIDRHSLRKNLYDSTVKPNIIPIPINLDIVLLPVKVRKAISKNDGSYAYISLSRIKQVRGERNAAISLVSGYEINSIETSKSVNRKIFLGNKARERFALNVLGSYNLSEGMSGVGFEYTRPATKGDLFMLAYEIMKLRKAFERKGGETYE